MNIMLTKHNQIHTSDCMTFCLLAPNGFFHGNIPSSYHVLALVGPKRAEE